MDGLLSWGVPITEGTKVKGGGPQEIGKQPAVLLGHTFLLHVQCCAVVSSSSGTSGRAR
jgi:hypothetical protein